VPHKAIIHCVASDSNHASRYFTIFLIRSTIGPPTSDYAAPSTF
jgi:hypothetical protein